MDILRYSLRLRQPVQTVPIHAYWNVVLRVSDDYPLQW
jgi:hypothetical protein